MKIIVCIKQVPDTNDVKWSRDNNLIREGLISIINPYDILAIQTALDIKEKIQNTKITLLSMGPACAAEALEDGLGMGCDEAYLLSDKRFSGSDTLATARTLSYAIKNIIKDFDLIITGQFATDGDTAQTSYSLSNMLDIKNIGYVCKIDDVKKDEITVLSAKDNGIYKIKGKFPLLISISKYDGKIYKPKIQDYIKAQNTEIKILNADDIKIDAELTGIKGSPTYVKKAFRPQNERKCVFIETGDILNEIKTNE